MARHIPLLIIGLVSFMALMMGCIASPTVCDEAYSPVCGKDGITYKNLCKALAAGATVAYGGECVNCTDTDNGKNIMQAGTTTFNGNTSTDFCLDGKLTEFYCESGDIQKSTETCPAGYVCESGACTLPKCIDTDNGVAPSSAGKATKGDIVKEDFCLDSQRAIKYYCDGNEIKETAVPCQAGYACSQGKCIEKCTSTSSLYDSPYDIYAKDTVTLGSVNKTDTCFNSQKVIDYFCTPNGQIDSQVTVCPVGFVCEDGACKSNSCQDSDGRDIYTPSKAFVRGIEYPDVCVSGQYVKEYYCEGPKLQTFTKKCPEGYDCYSGACVNLTASCYDTDVGEDKYVRGDVIYQYPQGQFTRYRDECINSYTVKEYFCTEYGAADYKLIQCPNSYVCSVGKCIPQAQDDSGSIRYEYCYDTDGGNFPKKYGVLSYGTATYQDTCLSLVALREYYCPSSYTYAFQVHNANNYQECWEGKIWDNIYCIDPDISEGENAIFKRTTVIRGHQAQTDQCEGSQVKEYYCSPENQIVFRYVTCPKGCSNGACILDLNILPLSKVFQGLFVKKYC
ncbi:MAG: Kazal-type serine protease inhibitor [Candidatus Micrarchaeota archaeon]|nr:Kazal-type serine protease inhibitor [Candidatus Micrarchaeota archaeon]